MKRLVNGILTASLMAAVLVFSGCEKNEAGKGNGTGANTFSGVYDMAVNPLYSDMKAVDEAATAIELQDMKVTYAQIIMAAYATLPQIQLSAYPTEITFNPDGTLKVVEKNPVKGDDMVFPDKEYGISSEDLTYSRTDNELTFLIGSDMIDAIIDANGKGPEFSAAVKAVLAKFTKGVAVYSASDNTAKITLHYTINGKELSVYVDQALLQETWNVAQDAKEEILAFVGAGNPEIVPIIEALIPQVDNMLKTGFSKIEVGMRLTKK